MTIQIRFNETKMVPIKELKPHPENPNDHTDEQIDRLCQILKYQGMRYPIKVSNRSGFITSGHGRLLALKKLGVKEALVSYQDYDSEEQEYADVVADNAIASWALLNLTKINQKLPELGPDFDILNFGLKDFILEPADKLEPVCDEDDTPELPTESKVKRGDIYVLGNHRLMCGDSTMIDDVEKLMNGEKADLWLSDPPYGVDIKNTAIERYKNTGRGGTQANHEEIANDVSDKAGWGEFLRKTFTNAHIACTDKASHYVFTPQGSDKMMMMMMMMMQESGWNIRHELIWRKNRFILGRSDYHYQHEPILYGWKINGIHEWHGGRDKSSIFDHEVSKNDLHPTMKPVELLMSITKNSTRSGYRILDLFGGSGSTLIACEKTDRKCFMMELSEHYCAVILDRWEKYSGKKAMHENGKSWSDIKNG